MRKIYKRTMKKWPVTPGRSIYIFKCVTRPNVLLPDTIFTITEILFQYRNGIRCAEQSQISKKQAFFLQAFGTGFRCPAVDTCDNFNHCFFIPVILDLSPLLDTVDHVLLLTHRENVLAIDRYTLKSLFSFHSIWSRCP